MRIVKYYLSICFLFQASCSDFNYFSINFTLKQPNDKYISRIYTNMWGGGGGGVDYLVNIQKKGEEFDGGENIVFNILSGDGIICIDWVDNNIYISTSIDKNISIKKDVLFIGDKKINIAIMKENKKNIISNNCANFPSVENQEKMAKVQGK